LRANLCEVQHSKRGFSTRFIPAKICTSPELKAHLQAQKAENAVSPPRDGKLVTEKLALNLLAQ
jgi:hypothetical protein